MKKSRSGGGRMQRREEEKESERAEKNICEIPKYLKF